METLPPLLALPAEIRDIIYHHLFDQHPKIYHQRTPSRKRLRCSKVNRNETKGVLQTCRLIRQETIPLFYRKHASLVFHSSPEMMEYINDKDIHPSIKLDITRVAIDIGDADACKYLRERDVDHLAEAFTLLPCLETVEAQVYARTCNDAANKNREAMNYSWWLLCKACDPVPVLQTSEQDKSNLDFVRRFVPDHFSSSYNFERTLCIILQNRIRLFHRAMEDTPPRSLITQPPSLLSVCKILLSRTDQDTTILGGLEEAIARRKKVVGDPKADTSMLDTDVYNDVWCTNGVAVKETPPATIMTQSGQRYERVSSGWRTQMDEV